MKARTSVCANKKLRTHTHGIYITCKLVADIAVFNCLETISTMLSGAADKYENVKKINTLVKQNSNITKYLDSRVKTPF
jgi:hypothetical protein